MHTSHLAKGWDDCARGSDLRIHAGLQKRSSLRKIATLCPLALTSRFFAANGTIFSPMADRDDEVSCAVSRVLHERGAAY